MKSSAKISKLLQTAIDEVKTATNITHREKLNFVANRWQNGSEISAQECVYHLLSMPFTRCSREVIFILTFPISERYHMVKSKEVLKNMNPNSTDIYVDGLIEHYISRPDVEFFETMCLVIFAAWYDFVSNTSHAKLTNKKKNCTQRKKKMINNFIVENNDDDGFTKMIDENYLNGDEPTQSEYFQLLHKSGWIKCRKRSKLVRYRGYDQTKQDELKNYYREQLLLFLPFRDEKEEIDDLSNHQNVFKNKYTQEIIAHNKADFNNIFGDTSIEKELNEMADNLEIRYQEEFQKEHDDHLNAEAILRAEFGELDEEDQHIREALESEYGYYSNINIDEARPLHVSRETEERQFFNPKIIDNNIYYEQLSTLNVGQQQYILTIMKKLANNEVFHSFLTGPGGCGKSFTIRVVNQALLRQIERRYPKGYYGQGQPNQQPCHIVMSSFLGKVAFRLRGTTLHSAFSIGVNDFDDNRNYESLKKRFGVDTDKETCALRLIVIDEASLVGKKLVNIIDSKLRGMRNKPEVTFGGISSILCGDFNQNKPCGDKWLFAKDDNNYSALRKNCPTNELWDQYEIFELTEIMRQKDDKQFSEALTCFGNTGFVGLPAKYIDLFNKRIRPVEEIPEHALHLFMTNEDQQKFNSSKIKEPDFLQFAKDRVLLKGADEEKTIAIYNAYKYKITGLSDYVKHNMPDVLKIKIGIRYMLVYNLNVPDGLANGTVGCLVNFIQCENTQTTNDDSINLDQLEYLFFDFYEEDVGNEQRQNLIITDTLLKRLHRKMSKNEIQKYTSIKRSKGTFRIASDLKWRIERLQFLLVPCEAVTIAKIQGDTCEAVALDISQTCFGDLRSHYYVAMSRVTRLQDLYLYGAKDFMQNKRVGKGYNFKNVFEKSFVTSLTEEEQQKAKQYFLNNNEIQVEMTRLRNERKFKLNFELIFSKQHNGIRIMFYNINGNFKDKKKVLEADFGIKYCDFLILTNLECDLTNVTVDNHYTLYNFNEFKLLSACGLNYQSDYHGSLVYINKNSSPNITLIKILSNKNDKCEIELFKVLFQSRWLFISYVQNYLYNQRELKDCIKHFFTKVIRLRYLTNEELKSNLFLFLSNNNLDEIIENSYITTKLYKHYQLVHLFDKNLNVCCLSNSDLVVDNVGNIHKNCMDYESYFSLISPFLPLWLNIHTNN